MNNHTATTPEEIWSFIKETNKQMKETNQKMEKLSAETNQQIKETIQGLKEARKLFETQWGKLMESLVEGDLLNLLNKQGIKVINTHPNVQHRSETDQYEYDIIASNGKEIVVVEVKTTLKVKHIKDFLEDVKKLTCRLPDFKGKIIYGAVAFLRAEEESARHAESQGLFVIRATGNSSSIINKKNFKPKAFS